MPLIFPESIQPGSVLRPEGNHLGGRSNQVRFRDAPNEVPFGDTSDNDNQDFQ